MDPRRLELLLELSRLGSMREVGESMHVTTSTVSQQIAVLAQEAGAPLTEPHGRRVRLTPAGQRLAGHAVTILAAIEAARLDLDPTGVPTGTVRVAAFATAVRESVLPVVRLLAERHPAVLLVIHEHEPDEALGLLADDAVDLALTYDYNLAPARFDRSLTTRPLGLRQWGLGTPTALGRVAGTTLEVFRRFADHDWIVNSRNSGDEEVIRMVASLADFQPQITHRVDSLELVQDMILAGLGVGLLPAGRPVRRGVVLRALGQPAVTQRPFAVTRLGRSAWPPLALVLQLLGEISDLTARRVGHPPYPGRGAARYRARQIELDRNEWPPWELLRSGCRLVFRDEVGRHPTAVLDVVAVPLGPFADLGGVDGGSAAEAAWRAAGGAAYLAAVLDVLPERLAQLIGVLAAEVNLVVRAVQAEPDRAVRRAAVDVVNEERLNPLGHEFLRGSMMVKN